MKIALLTSIGSLVVAGAAVAGALTYASLTPVLLPSSLWVDQPIARSVIDPGATTITVHSNLTGTETIQVVIRTADFEQVAVMQSTRLQESFSGADALRLYRYSDTWQAVPGAYTLTAQSFVKGTVAKSVTADFTVRGAAGDPRPSPTAFMTASTGPTSGMAPEMTPNTTPATRVAPGTSTGASSETTSGPSAPTTISSGTSSGTTPHTRSSASTAPSMTSTTAAPSTSSTVTTPLESGTTATTPVTTTETAVTDPVTTTTVATTTEPPADPQAGSITLASSADRYLWVNTFTLTGIVPGSAQVYVDINLHNEEMRPYFAGWTSYPCVALTKVAGSGSAAVYSCAVTITITPPAGWISDGFYPSMPASLYRSRILVDGKNYYGTGGNWAPLGRPA